MVDIFIGGGKAGAGVDAAGGWRLAAEFTEKFAENPNLRQLFVSKGLSGVVFTKKFAENPNLCKLFAPLPPPSPNQSNPNFIKNI